MVDQPGVKPETDCKSDDATITLPRHILIVCGIADEMTHLYEPNETESASKMTSNVSALISFADYIVESTEHVSRRRNTQFLHLIHQRLQLRPLWESIIQLQ